MEVRPSPLLEALIHDARERARRSVSGHRVVFAFPLVQSDAEDSEAPSVSGVTRRMHRGSATLRAFPLAADQEMHLFRVRPKAPSLPGPGWRWLCTRGYNLEAPAAFAFR